MNHISLKTTAARGLLALALGVSAMATAQATQCPLIPSGVAEMADTERAMMLSGFKFAELDKALAAQHKKNLSSAGTDLVTLRDLLNLQQLSGRKENLFRMWADERPDSFFAQLNAGLFYANQANSARGSEAASKVSAAAMRNVSKVSDVAVGYLQKAATIDPRSAMPAAAMMSLSAMLGEVGGRNTAQWLDVANKADPRNLSARIQAVSYLSPRWGGSFDALDQMSSQAEKALSSEGAYYLKYNVLIAKASHFEVIERDKAKALAAYKQAKGMCDNSESAREGMVRNY